MRLLSQMNNGQAYSLSAHSSTRGTRADPLCVGYVPDGKVFSLISSLPSSLSADVLSVFVRMIHRYYAAVRLLADVHAGRVAEASCALFRFIGLCMSCALNPDPGRLAALRVERHDRQRGTGVALLGVREPGDRGPDVGGLDDVVAAAFLHRALPLAHPHLHGGDHHAFGPEPLDVFLQLLPRVVPGVVDELGVADHLGVTSAPAGLAYGQPVIVPGAYRDAEGEP